MIELIRELAEYSARLLEVIGIATIVLGALYSTYVFLRDARRSTTASDPNYRQYRRRLGRAILIGLELLVGADIIATVAVEPNFTNVGVLAVIVLIRTFLSLSLEVEIDGRWPWQSKGQEQFGVANGNEGRS